MCRGDLGYRYLSVCRVAHCLRRGRHFEERWLEGEGENVEMKRGLELGSGSRWIQSAFKVGLCFLHSVSAN